MVPRFALPIGAAVTCSCLSSGTPAHRFVRRRSDPAFTMRSFSSCPLVQRWQRLHRQNPLERPACGFPACFRRCQCAGAQALDLHPDALVDASLGRRLSARGSAGGDRDRSRAAGVDRAVQRDCRGVESAGARAHGCGAGCTRENRGAPCACLGRRRHRAALSDPGLSPSPPDSLAGDDSAGTAIISAAMENRLPAEARVRRLRRSRGDGRLTPLAAAPDRVRRCAGRGHREPRCRSARAPRRHPYAEGTMRPQGFSLVEMAVAVPITIGDWGRAAVARVLGSTAAFPGADRVGRHAAAAPRRDDDARG